MEEKKQYKILAVDDDPFTLDLLRIELKRAGYGVHTAHNGQTAVERAKDETPDLILLDVMMPGMSGFEVTQSLKHDEALKHIPIILLSAKTETEDKVEGLDAGADDYVVKPFDFEEVHARIQAQLRIKELEQKLVQAERMRVLAEMAGAAAHELAQPITYAMVKMEILIRNSEKSGEVSITSEDLKGIYHALEKTSEVINKIQHIRSYRTKSYHSDFDIIDIDKASR